MTRRQRVRQQQKPVAHSWPKCPATLSPTWDYAEWDRDVRIVKDLREAIDGLEKFYKKQVARLKRKRANRRRVPAERPAAA